jgi:hypothetical protein
VLRLVIPLELEFGRMLMQMLHADVMEGAYDSALQQARLGVDGRA